VAGPGNSRKRLKLKNKLKLRYKLKLKYKLEYKLKLRYKLTCRGDLPGRGESASVHFACLPVRLSLVATLEQSVRLVCPAPLCPLSTDICYDKSSHNLPLKKS